MCRASHSADNTRRDDIEKGLAITAVAALCALAAAALLPGESNGGAKAPSTIGLINEDGAEGFVSKFENGGRSAAKALGDHLAITRANDTPTRISRIKIAGRTARGRDRDPHRRPREAGTSGSRTGARRRHPDGVLRTALSRQRLGQPGRPGTVRAGARRRTRLAAEPARPVCDRLLPAVSRCLRDRRHLAEVDQGLHRATLPADATGRGRLRRPRKRRR